MKTSAIGPVCILAVAVLVGGCGGGNGGAGSVPPPPGGSSGVLGGTSSLLDDGSPYRQFDFVAKGSGPVAITVSSTSFEVLLSVERIDASGVATVLDEQESGSTGSTARVHFNVLVGGYYVAIIAGTEPQPSGAFTVQYPENLLVRQATRAGSGVRDPGRLVQQLPSTDGFQRPFFNVAYGYRFLENDGGIPHPGVDYNGAGGGDEDLGKPYYAVAQGLVVSANSGSWGSIVIRHLYQGETVYSQYAHSEPSRVFVAVGQSVHKGQLIGTIGKKGDGYAHLHWEIRTSSHPYPEMASYWPTDVLTIPMFMDRCAKIRQRYYDPEWWVDNHGPYAAYLPVACVSGVAVTNESSTQVTVVIENRGLGALTGVAIPIVQLGATHPAQGEPWNAGALSPGASTQQVFTFSPGLGQKKASLLTATLSSADGQLRLRTRILR